MSVSMADFSFLSDTDDSAVEDVLSQAMDLAVLEQVAAINCSGTSDSELPTHLETRFRKLKSFPPPNSVPKILPSLSSKHLQPVKSVQAPLETGSTESVKAKTQADTLSDDDDESFFASKENTTEKENPTKSVSRSLSSSSFTNSPVEKEISSELKELSCKKKGSDGKSRSASLHMRSNSSSSDSSMDCLSSPKKFGCFWCSPKKDSRKKKKENRVSGRIGVNWDKSEELLSELNSFSFSSKEQRRIMKMAMKEEEKISREAEKIVKWAKQASARMDISGIQDELSDDESTR